MRRERFSITADYYTFVTGELDKGKQTLQAWAQAYPRESMPHIDLTVSRLAIKGNTKTRSGKSWRAFSCRPNLGLPIQISWKVTRPSIVSMKPRRLPAQALKRHLEVQFFHDDLYAIAFLEGDADEMKRQVVACKRQTEVLKTCCFPLSPIQRPSMVGWNKHEGFPAKPSSPPYMLT